MRHCGLRSFQPPGEIVDSWAGLLTKGKPVEAGAYQVYYWTIFADAIF
jgi:hypothetical protein